MCLQEMKSFASPPIRLGRIWLLLFAIMILTAACGQKGGLYLPDKTRASQPSLADSA